MDVDEDETQLERVQLERSREQRRESLERFFAAINDEELFPFMSTTELRVYQERINRHFELFEEADNLYRQRCILVTDRLFIEIEQQFMTTMARLHDRIQEQASFSEPARSSSSPLEPRLSTIIKVETMREPQIGKFNGNAADWPAFRDLFVAEVHNKSYDPVTKLLYLQGACIEKAASTLGPWQPTASNYAAAWDILQKAYDDNYHVIHGILGRMHAVRSQDRETYDSLRLIVDALNSGTRQLETMASPDQILDQVWIHYGKQRLPKYTLDAWEQQRNRGGALALPTVEEFKNFLDVKSKGRREFEGENVVGTFASRNITDNNHKEQHSNGTNRRKHDNRQHPYNRDERNTGQRNHNDNRWNRDHHQQSHNQNDQVRRNPFQRSITNPAQNSNPERALVEANRCMVEGCTQKHPVYMCEIFKQSSLEEHRNIVKTNRLCWCCLNRGHNAASCSRDTCSQCPDEPIKHHFRLCQKVKQNYGGNSRAQPGNTIERPANQGNQ